MLIKLHELAASSKSNWFNIIGLIVFLFSTMCIIALSIFVVGNLGVAFFGSEPVDINFVAVGLLLLSILTSVTVYNTQEVLEFFIKRKRKKEDKRFDDKYQRLNNSLLSEIHTAIMLQDSSNTSKINMYQEVEFIKNKDVSNRDRKIYLERYLNRLKGE